MSDVIKLTKPNGLTTYVVKSQIVVWYPSEDRKTGTHISLVNGFQDVQEKPEQVLIAFERA